MQFTGNPTSGSKKKPSHDLHLKEKALNLPQSHRYAKRLRSNAEKTPSSLSNEPVDSAELTLTYEDGTIILTGLSPAKWALDEDLPDYLIWDSRIGAYRAPAHQYRLLKAWVGELRIKSTDLVSGWRHVPNPKFRAPKLREYQEEAVWAWKRAATQGIIALPTGSGKTRVALSAMALLGLPVLVLVPTRVLMSQWISELKNVYDGEVGQMGDGVQRLRVVTVSTFESAYRHMERFGNRFGLLVVDEAHHFASGLRAEALEMTVAPHRMGLTATPPKEPEPSMRLMELLGPVVFGKTVTEMAGTYLAGYETITLPVTMTPDEELSYNRHKGLFMGLFRRFKAQNPLGSWPDFVTWARDESGGTAALRAWHAARSILSLPKHKKQLVGDLLKRYSQRRVLVFTRDNASAYDISKEFLIPAITCHIKSQERKEVLSKFASGEIKALVSARVLNEGVDVPEAEVAIITGGSMGEREHLQRVGRVLRPRQNKTAIIYDLVVQETTESRAAKKHTRALSIAPGGRAHGLSNTKEQSKKEQSTQEHTDTKGAKKKEKATAGVLVI